MKGTHFKVDEEKREGFDVFLGPTGLGNVSDETVLGHSHLSPGKVLVSNDIARSCRGGYRANGHDVVDLGKAEGFVGRGFETVGGIFAAFWGKIPEFNVFTTVNLVKSEGRRPRN